MTPQDYAARRAKLVSEYNKLIRLRLNRSAAARVRMIADLDYEYDHTPKDKTKSLFNYDKLIKQ